MRHTYILKSSKNNKYYIGSTYDINKRLSEHNSGKVKSTKLNKPWSIYYFEKFENEKDAILRERQIKAWKSRKMIEKLKFTRPRPSRDEVGKQSRGSSISQSNLSDLSEIGTTPEPTP